MILADTSVWISHLRQNSSTLRSQLNGGKVLMHPMIIGELACGSFRCRAQVLAELAAMRVAALADHFEVMKLIEDHSLWGSGIGWVDANLIASAMLSRCALWTRDRRLQRAASRAGASVFSAPEDVLQ